MLRGRTKHTQKRRSALGSFASRNNVFDCSRRLTKNREAEEFPATRLVTVQSNPLQTRCLSLLVAACRCLSLPRTRPDPGSRPSRPTTTTTKSTTTTTKTKTTAMTITKTKTKTNTTPPSPPPPPPPQPPHRLLSCRLLTPVSPHSQFPPSASTMNYSSDDEASPVAPPPPPAVSSGGKAKAQGNSSFPVIPVAVAGVGALVVGIGAWMVRGRRKGARQANSGTKGAKKSSTGGNAKVRKAPPRRPRSVASSVDGGQGVKRYVWLGRFVSAEGEASGGAGRDGAGRHAAPCTLSRGLIRRWSSAGIGRARRFVSWLVVRVSWFAHCAFALPLYHLQSGRDAFGGGDPGGEGRVGEEAGVQGAGVAAEEEARCCCS